MSDEVKIFPIEKNVISVEGALTFHTVEKLRQESVPILKNRQSIQINLSKVTHCDSAGLALLIEWQRYASEQLKSIQFQHLPEQLIKIAKVSQLDAILNIAVD